MNADGSPRHPTLAAHLGAYLGAWPATGGVEVVGTPIRTQPAWDGAIVPAVVVSSPEGTVISVPPGTVDEVRGLAQGLAEPGFGDRLATAVGADGRASGWLMLRWTADPAPLPPVGTWVEPTHPGLPAWLHPFPSPVLVAFEDDGDGADGAYLAGVGIKPHSRWGRELAVGTAEHAQGRGLARRLVAQAAERMLAEGAVPLYVHDPDNVASAKAADAAGFHDKGWRLLVVFAPPPRTT